MWRLSSRKAVRAIMKPEGSVQEPGALGKGRSWGGGRAVTAQDHSEGETVQESPLTQSQCHHFYNSFNKPAVSPSNPSEYSLEAFSR